MRRFFMDFECLSVRGEIPETVTAAGDDAHHIRAVLRMGSGDRLILFDGSGVEYEAVIAAIAGDAVTLQIIRQLDISVESPLALAVAQGLLKDKKMDVLVRHLTELGMTRWVPFQAERSIPRLDDHKRRVRAERWKKIAREALKQCGRSLAPQVGEVIGFDQLFAAAEGYALKLFFWERAVDALPEWPDDAATRDKSVFMVLGPEGGFSEDEAACARAAGFALVSLGPRILRAETAALAACTVVQYRYGDMASGRLKTP